MRARDRLVTLLPWVLCAAAVALLVLAGVLHLVLGPGSGRTAEQAEAAAIEAIGFMSFPLVGAVIAARLPANPYGWLWCSLAVTYGVLALGGALGNTDLGSGWTFTAVANLAYWGLFGQLVFVFLLFPTGRLPSHRWRWLPRATVLTALLLAVATPFAPSVLAPDTRPPWSPNGALGRLLADVADAGVLAMLALFLVAMASLMPRYRSGGAVERRQLKWFLLAAAVNGVYGVVDLLVGVPVGPRAYVLIEVLTFSLIPLAVGIAVLRYRLYDIDRIISRTVSWGLLSAGLVGLYLLVVALLRPLLEPLTGNSSLAVAGSTLAVAAAFNPARRRLQEAVDRRFDRSRYDAARAVEAFAARLRNEVDLDQVTAGLRETVVATVAPTRVAVWLRAPSRSGAEP